MLVRQAIVASPRSRALKDNELISRSDGIGDELEQTLCLWSPGRTGFGFGQKQSTNFFQLDADTFALSRSIVGLDNDRDEGRRVVSKVVLLNRDQLSGFRNNTALLFHLICSAGLMTFETSPAEKLPLLEVPDRAFAELGEFARSEYAVEIERIVHAVNLHHRVVILGLKNPLSFMCSFLSGVTESERLDFSFATGLKVDDAQRFVLQFFSESQPDLLKELAGRQIRTISLDSKPVMLY